MGTTDLQKRELGFWELFTLSKSIFTTNFMTILWIVLIVYLPINVILFVISDGVLADVGGLEIALEAVFGIIAIMAVSYMTFTAVTSTPVDHGTALSKALNRWPAAFGTILLTGLAIFGLLLLLIVPGIIFLVYWFFVIEIVVLLNKSGVEAMKYSKQVVNNRWWRVFGYSLLLMILLGAFSFLASLPFTIFEESNPVWIVHSLLLDVLYTFTLVFSTLFLLNLDATKATSEKNSSTAKTVAAKKVVKKNTTPKKKTAKKKTTKK